MRPKQVSDLGARLTRSSRKGQVDQRCAVCTAQTPHHTTTPRSGLDVRWMINVADGAWKTGNMAAWTLSYRWRGDY